MVGEWSMCRREGLKGRDVTAPFVAPLGLSRRGRDFLGKSSD